MASAGTLAMLPTTGSARCAGAAASFCSSAVSSMPASATSALRCTAHWARCCVRRPEASEALARARAASAGAVKPALADRSVSRAVSERERVSDSATRSCCWQARSAK